MTKSKTAKAEKLERIPFIAKIENGEPLLVFPDISANIGRVTVYRHVGQHGEAAVSYVAGLRPAKEGQFEALLQEWCGLGLDPLPLSSMKRYRRLQRNHLDTAWSWHRKNSN